MHEAMTECSVPLNSSNSRMTHIHMEKHEAVRTHEHCVQENGQITQETPITVPSKVHL